MVEILRQLVLGEREEGGRGREDNLVPWVDRSLAVVGAFAAAA